MPAFFHALETALPLKAPSGYFSIKGWCLAADSSRAPLVRLVEAATFFPVSVRLARPDVLAVHQGAATAVECGFVIAGHIAPGVHLVALEASVDGETWSKLREFTLFATGAELQFSVEWPAGPVVTESVRVQGWCLHPDFPLREVSLHYGNKKIACEYGLPRSDVPALFPGVAHAAASGFIAVKNLPASRGPLRIRAVGENGQVCHITTPIGIDISIDEDHPRPLLLAGTPASLGPPRVDVRPKAPATVADRPKRILFVLYGDFTSNSAFHVAQLANQLIQQGHECIVAVPDHIETIAYHPSALFRPILFSDYEKDPARFREHRAATLVHAWTTRENVRCFCDRIGAGRTVPLVIHLEDHEQHILEATLRRPREVLLALPDGELDTLVPPTLSHPVRSQEFLGRAQAVTIILDRLRELVPAGIPSQVIWPAADETTFFARPMPHAFRRALHWDDRHTVLFYHGNVHPTNRDEVRELYLAVLQLNAGGRPTTLIRTGRNFCAFVDDLKAELASCVIDLGQIDHQHHLPPLMALADFFVQPGKPDRFNDYRFPSKLPEFFSIGRPVILPRTNLGETLRHLEDAFVLETADASAIAGAINTLQEDPALRRKLSENALRFQQAHFSWSRSAAQLNAFYNQLPSVQ